MSGKAPDVSIGSGAASAAAPGTTRHATRIARTTRVARMNLSPPRTRAPDRCKPVEQAVIQYSGQPLSRMCPRADRVGASPLPDGMILDRGKLVVVTGSPAQLHFVKL